MDYKDYINNTISNDKNKYRSPFLRMVDEVLGISTSKVDPITNKADLTQEEKELVDVVVKTFEGYNYTTKKEQDTVIIIFNQNVGGDLIKKWANIFPYNEYKGIKMDVEVKSK